MARTPSVTAGTAHPSGYTTNTREHKLLRELFELLVNLGWSEDAAKAAILGGLDEVDCFVNLNEAEVLEIVKAIRRTDVEVGVMKKLYLHWLCWVARHHARIGRDISWPDVDPEWILTFKDQWELEKEHENPDIVFPKATAAALKDPAKFLEEMISFLDQIRTADGVRLSYLLREKCIPDETETCGHADSPL